MSDPTVAQTIISQINAIDPMAFAAWGAKEKTYSSDSFRFKSSGMTRWKGYVEVKYNAGSDMYSVKFMRVRKMEIKVDKEVEDVFAPDLVKVIDEQVG
jgi:hypothetical protein